MTPAFYAQGLRFIITIIEELGLGAEASGLWGFRDGSSVRRVEILPGLACVVQCLRSLHIPYLHHADA